MDDPTLQVADNPNTGETLVRIGNDWKKAEQIADSKDGQQSYLVEGKWHTTPGGATVGNPNQARPQLRSFREGSGLGEATGEILGAGAIGTVGGYFAPELLQGAAMVAPMLPYGSLVAPWLNATGVALKAHRLGSAGTGLIGGLIGETGGQAMEAAGANQFLAEGTRFVGSAIGPDAARFGIFLTKKALQAPAMSIENKMWKETAKAMVAKLEGRPQDLGEQERQMLDDLVADFRRGAKSPNELNKVFGGLEAGSAEALLASQNEANRILATSQRSAHEEISAAMKGDIFRRREALPRLQEIGDKAIAAARGQRSTLGADRTVSEQGDELRGLIVPRHKAAIDARKVEDTVLRQKRDDLVKQQEAAGKYLEDVPEYKELVRSLENKLLAAPEARMGTELRQVSDPSTEKAYSTLLEAMSKKRIAVSAEEAAQAQGQGLTVIFDGKNPLTKEPQAYRVFKNSFDALDDVRRKLGTVFSRQPAEGYEAIGADIAHKYYAQIGDIQKKYAGGKGGIQDVLQTKYADATEGLQRYGTPGGKRLTAVERYDDTKFVADASSIPGYFFRSKQGVQDLIELTGDKAYVVKAGKEFASDQLRDLNESQVRSWMTKNRDWLTTTPEGQQVWLSVSKYADVLQRGEGVARSIAAGKGKVEAQIVSMTDAANKASGSILAAGEKDAGKAIKYGEDLAAALVGDKFQSGNVKLGAERVRQLIESGNARQWDITSAAIHKSPEAKAAFPGAVRQVIADRAETSVKGLSEFFERKVRLAAESTGLLSKQEAAEMSRKILAIENMKIPEQDKYWEAKRMLLQAIGGYSATGVARGMSAMVPD